MLVPRAAIRGTVVGMLLSATKRSQLSRLLRLSKLSKLSQLSQLSQLSPAKSSPLLRHTHTTCSRSKNLNLSSGQATHTTAPSPSKDWPKYEIPQGAPQLIYEAKASDPITISWTDELLLLQHGPDTAPRALRPATLRDSCTCSACKDPSSGQKSFASIEIPPNVGISSVRPTGAGLAISFSNDIPRFRGHEMTLAWNQLGRSPRRTSSNPASKSSILGRTGVQYWDAATLGKHVRKIDYAAFMQGGTAFWDAIIDICRLGIVYLNNVPRHEDSVVQVTTRIANIRETFYGRTFDVRAKPKAENVAYTSGYLGLHQDLCYLQPPPMIQVLHCMDNSCAGGESLFSDGERAGRLLWPFVAAGSGSSSSSKMRSLAQHKVPYQYDKHGYFYHADRPVIDVDDDDGAFAGVYWSPPFQGAYTHTHAGAAQDIAPWIEAARLFEGLVNDAAAVHSYKMQPGECVLFDNLRAMHGRTAFDARGGGSRWLRGAYIAKEDFLSRAAYIPDGQAEMYRGTREEWTADGAQADLRRSQWWPDVVRSVKDLDDGPG